MGSIVVVLAQEPVRAIAQVTSVRLNQTSRGVDVVMEISPSDRQPTFSEIFMVDLGSSLTIDLMNTQLRLAGSNSFHQDNPGPGIASIAIIPREANNIQIVVIGINGAPLGKISKRDSNGITLSFQSSTSGALAIAPTPNIVEPPPKITINGVEVLSPNSEQTSPLLSGAVDLSIGDITVPLNHPPAAPIRLGKAVRIRRLLLQNVPVQDVLSLLARAVDLNVTFTDSDSASQSQQQLRTSAVATNDLQKSTISLDIENEEVENIFNYVLQFSDLQARRVENTIFVSKYLPREVEERVISRSFQLNQKPARLVAGYLFSLGIERDRSSQTNADTLCFAKKNSLPIWPGLQVRVDEQKNVLTLRGSRQLVESATAKLRNLYECNSSL